MEQGQITIAYIEEDALKRSGATPQSVQGSSLDDRMSKTPASTQVREPKSSELQNVLAGVLLTSDKSHSEHHVLTSCSL